MLSKIQTLEAEVRGVQLLLGNMLAHVLITAPDLQKQVDGFREEIEMSCAAASLSEISEKNREAYRDRMRLTALATVAAAANMQMYQRTTDQH